MERDREEADHFAENAFVVRERVGKGDENDDIRGVRLERALKEMAEHESGAGLNTVLHHHHSPTLLGLYTANAILH